ncbi:MAG: hypothetical protein IJ806_11240 [Ruminococcus sp.]|nr:hypothetical protein [Ruminococcus sp.]
MKLRLTVFHKIGAGLVLVGLVILITGLAGVIKYAGRTDISELTQEDLKNGKYVTGTVDHSLTAFPKGYAEDPWGTEQAAADVFTTDSEYGEDGRFSMFLTNAAPETGKLMVMAVDEVKSTELYLALLMNNSVGNGVTFDGVIVRNSRYDERIRDFLKRAPKDYDLVLDGNRIMGDLNEDSVSLYVIEVRDMSMRNLMWLFSLPFIMGGIIMIAGSGSPYKRIR